jgi:GAF domain-containing protein
MAPKGGSVLNEPRSAVEIADSIRNCRDLIRIADVQLEKARTDLGVARLGLAELEEELSSRGMAAPNGESPSC